MSDWRATSPRLSETHLGWRCAWQSGGWGEAEVQDPRRQQGCGVGLLPASLRLPGIAAPTFRSSSEPSFFSHSDKFTRFCQWKNVELNIHVSGSVGSEGCPPRGRCRDPSGGGCSGQVSTWRGWSLAWDRPRML